MPSKAAIDALPIPNLPDAIFIEEGAPGGDLPDVPGEPAPTPASVTPSAAITPDDKTKMAAGVKQGAREEAAAKAAAAAATAQPGGLSAEDLAELQQKAELMDYYNQQLASNPTSTIAGLTKDLTPKQRQELASSILKVEKSRPSGWEPQNEVEQALHESWDWITGGQETVQQNIKDEVAKVIPYLDNASVQVAILQAQVEALSELVSFKMPDVDLKAIYGDLQKGKSYTDAVKKHVNLTAALAAAGQAGKPRPDTPGNASNDLFERRPGRRMEEMLVAMKNGSLSSG